MLKLTFFLTFAAAVLARQDFQYDLAKAEEYFEEFIREYGKKYNDSAEKAKRFEIFKESLVKYNKMNMEDTHAMYGFHEYSDLTPEELPNRRGIIPRPQKLHLDENICAQGQIPEVKYPETWDWREHNAVTPVKNQGQCNSCWAFSVVGNVEGQYALKKGQLLQFSEQQLVDCDTKSLGCSGGKTDTPFLILKNGVMTEDDYPYIDANGTSEAHECIFDVSKAKHVVTGCEKFSIQNEEQIKQLLYARGPLSVDDNIPYWIFKNSWGLTWGENGYFKVKYGIGGCGFAIEPMTSALVV